MTTPNVHAKRVEPYLFFEGSCEEALAFYQKAVGAEIQGLMRFKDSPPTPGCPTPDPEKVMHVNFRIGETTVMASDGRCSGKRNFDGFALSLAAPTEAEAERWFAALSAGGQVEMPLGKTFFAARFGMLKDKFGVHWMVIAMA